MSDVLKFQKTGTPRTLFENAAEIAHDVDFVLMVCVMKNGDIKHHWSQLPSSLTALGAAETLKDAMLQACS